jgi:AcrR family transcriptional regulator
MEPNNPAPRDTKRERILSIAQTAFLEGGYDGTSMSEIASRVGGSKGSLYTYFRSKSDLFIAVIERVRDGQPEQIFDIQAQDIREFLAEFGRRLTALLLSDDLIKLHRIVIAEANRFPELGEALYEAGPKLGQLKLARSLNDAMVKGQLRSADADRAADHAIAFMLSSMYERRIFHLRPYLTTREINANIAAGVSAFMSAYAPEKDALLH